MPGCPSCGRPVAVLRPLCLYCGSALPPDALTAAEAARAQSVDAVPSATGSPAHAPASATAEARTLLVLQAEGTDPRPLATALALSSYEAGQRIGRGGYQLLKVLETGAAEEEAARLRGHGLTVHTVPEAEVREARAPRVVTGVHCNRARSRCARRTARAPWLEAT